MSNRVCSTSLTVFEINEQKIERDRIVTLSHIFPNLFIYPVLYETRFPLKQIKMM
jgi:hypothetical protein